MGQIAADDIEHLADEQRSDVIARPDQLDRAIPIALSLVVLGDRATTLCACILRDGITRVQDKESIA